MMTEKTRKWECCLAFLSLILLMRLSYGYNIGTNVTLDFHHELSSQDSSFFCVISLEGTPEPFFNQNEINLHGLRPGQAGRVDVVMEQFDRNVTLQIDIHDLQRIDEGLYSVNVVESIDGTFKPKLYESSVHVTYPPGQAECQIKNPPLPTENWLVVSCNATLGNDDSGYLICFQDLKQAPYHQPARHSKGLVTAAFWIDPTRQIQCCSSDAPDIDIDSCDDFAPPPLPPDDSLTSDKPDDITTKAGPPHSPSTTEDGSPPKYGKPSQLKVAAVIIPLAFTVAVIMILVPVAVIFVLLGGYEH